MGGEWVVNFFVVAEGLPWCVPSPLPSVLHYLAQASASATTGPKRWQQPGQRFSSGGSSGWAVEMVGGKKYPKPKLPKARLSLKGTAEEGGPAKVCV